MEAFEGNLDFPNRDTRSLHKNVFRLLFFYRDTIYKHLALERHAAEIRLSGEAKYVRRIK